VFDPDRRSIVTICRIVITAVVAGAAVMVGALPAFAHGGSVPTGIPGGHAEFSHDGTRHLLRACDDNRDHMGIVAWASNALTSEYFKDRRIASFKDRFVVAARHGKGTCSDWVRITIRNMNIKPVFVTVCVHDRSKHGLFDGADDIKKVERGSCKTKRFV
jgi:hypothetical protein